MADMPCPIWGTTATIEKDTGRWMWLFSMRAGGRYMVSLDVCRNIKLHEQASRLGNKQRAVITTWLVNQRRRGIERPDLTVEVVQSAVIGELSPMNVRERADRVLVECEKLAEFFGDEVYFSELDDELVFANTETAEIQEIRSFVNCLHKKGYVSATLPHVVALTVEGHERVAELQQDSLASRQIFVAMWFDKSIELFYTATEQAIKDAGYIPYRIDREAFKEKICDRIEVEIRRSRMVVADFTHEEKMGARGSVYFEAGLAHGLGIPVVWTCRQDQLSLLHSDTRQYPHIPWQEENLAAFKQQLQDRIEILSTT